jgi:hypothetical protein
VALSVLRELNADPMAIAIWNDATSCVDIGDILHIKNGLNPIPEFLELKEGKVNSAIAELLETNEESRDAAAEAFKDRFGPKGGKQLDRVLRQKKTGEQAISLLVKEKGIDPVTGYEIEVVETATRPENYDGQLRELLDRAGNTEEGVLDCIDGCLWLFAASGGRRRSLHAVKRFTELLEQHVAAFLLSPGQKNAAWDRDKIRSLSAAVRYPMAKPIYLRDFDARQIASLTYGQLHDNVLMYLDWNAFGKLIGKAGGEFKWGSRKDAGRARAMHPGLRPPLIRGQLPQVHFGGAVAYVTDPNLIEIFYDGVTPWSMAQNMVGNLQHIVRHNSGANTQ